MRCVNGMRTAAMTENRRDFWALMQAAREAIRENHACRFLAGKPRGFERPADCAPWDEYRYKVMPAEKAGVNDDRESQRSR